MPGSFSGAPFPSEVFTGASLPVLPTATPPATWQFECFLCPDTISCRTISIMNLQLSDNHKNEQEKLAIAGKPPDALTEFVA